MSPASLKLLQFLPAPGAAGFAHYTIGFAEKEKQFAAEHHLSAGANVVSGSLLAMASAIAKSGNVALPWSEAQRVVNEKRPQAAALPVLEWLVKSDLLIEDGPGGAVAAGGAAEDAGAEVRA